MKPTKLLEAIDRALYDAQDDGNRWHLGASIIGRECLREVFYMHRWAKVRKVDARMLRLFNRGHREEERIVGWLRAAGVKVIDRTDDGEQIRVVDATGHFGGSLDAELSDVHDIPRGQRALGEFKTHNAKSFANLCALGVLAAKPEHFIQMSIYMAARGYRFGLYVAVNKDDDDLYLEIIEWGAETEGAIKHANERAHHVLTSDEPPARLSDNPAFWKCRLCDFKGICHGQDVPEVNCRTCAHVAIGPAGTWNCTRQGWTFSKENEDMDASVREQLECATDVPPRMVDGCVQHVFNPHLLNGVTFKGGDMEANFSTLELKDGTIIYNGPNHTPSDRLCLSPLALTKPKQSTPPSRSSAKTRKKPTR